MMGAFTWLDRRQNPEHLCYWSPRSKQYIPMTKNLNLGVRSRLKLQIWSHPTYMRCPDEVPTNGGTVVAQSLSCMWLFATLWTAAHQASLSFTIFQNLLKLMTIDSTMPSSHLILRHPPSFLALNLSQHHGLFKWVDSSHQVTKVSELQMQHQSFQWIFRVDFL